MDTLELQYDEIETKTHVLFLNYLMSILHKAQIRAVEPQIFLSSVISMATFCWGF